MSTLELNSALAKHIYFDENNLWVDLTDGRKLAVPLVYFPTLQKASDKERTQFIISGGGTGLHWNEIDEDIDVKNLLLGIYDRRTRHIWNQQSQSA